jgi:hypothetical protein
VTLVLFWIPVVLLAAAAIAAIVSVRRSSLRITRDGVEIHNYLRTPTLIPLAEAARFEESRPAGMFASLVPKTGVLVLTDGTRLPVRSLSDPEAGTGVDALNARVESLRRTG